MDEPYPRAVVVTWGADALDGDPLSSMALSNVAPWSAVERLAALAVVVRGGGVYNPWTVARYWTGLWGRLSGRDIPATLLQAAREILLRLRCDLIDKDEVRVEWLSTLADPPNLSAVRAEVDVLIYRALASVDELL